MMTWTVAALALGALLLAVALWCGLRIHNELITVEYACHKAWLELQRLRERQGDERQIVAAIERHDAAATRYNRRIRAIPDRIVARFMGCRERELFGAADQASDSGS